MTSGNNKPLLTLMVCAYNQERFIREAVEAAFAQTYSPLEIVLSDDCSTDHTFEIMRELAEAYRGPHRLILNRNSTNLGLAGHSNRLAELAHGEFWVGAAGDDICFPNRVELVYEAWERSGRRAMAIQGGFINIDEKGNVIDDPSSCAGTGAVSFREEKPTMEDYVHTLKPEIVGGALACSPIPFSIFGPIPRALIHEDSIAAFRAICLGSLMYIETPLIKRRIHGNNLFSRRHEMATSWAAVRQQEERMIRDAKGRAVLYDVFLADLQVARKKKLISEDRWTGLKDACIHYRQLLSRRAEYAGAGTVRKFRILFSLWRARVDGPVIKWMLFRLLPAPVFRLMKVIGNSARSALKGTYPG